MINCTNIYIYIDFPFWAHCKTLILSILLFPQKEHSESSVIAETSTTDNNPNKSQREETVC